MGPILFPLKSVIVTTELRALELLQVCVLCRFQDAFNLAKKNLGIIITVCGVSQRHRLGLMYVCVRCCKNTSEKVLFPNLCIMMGQEKKKNIPKPICFWLCLKFGNTFHSSSLCKLGASLSCGWGAVNTNQKVGVPEGL